MDEGAKARIDDGVTNSRLRTFVPSRGYVRVADPAYGLIKFTAEEFCQNWLSTKKEGEEEGMALLFVAQTIV
jgi:hypothetical protein